MRKKKHIDFALYRGDKFIDLGSADYLAKKYNTTVKTIQWLAYSKQAKIRNLGKKSGMVVVNLGVDVDNDFE